MRPHILVTPDLGTSLRRGVSFPRLELKQAYLESVERAGGLPLVASPSSPVEALLALAGGILITGGAFDIDPAAYGQARRGVRLDATKPARTRFELALLQGALERELPVLAVCGGMQLLAVAFGGSLIQDIGSEVAGALEHEQPTSPAEPAHEVALWPGSWLAGLAGRATIEVNTTHHQAVEALGGGLVALGRAPDGVVEAVGFADRDDVLGVQWHPELLDDDVSRALYGHLVERAAR